MMDERLELKIHGMLVQIASGVYLLPRMGLDLGEFEFRVVWIHLANLIARRRP